MENLDRIRRATIDYQVFPGLRALPFGLVFALSGLQKLEVIPWPSHPAAESTLKLVWPLAIVLWFVADRYYERRFGKVEPLEKRGPVSVVNTALPIAILVVVVVEEVLFLRGMSPPFSMVDLCFGLMFLVGGISTRRWDYILAGPVLIIAAFLPLIMGVPLSDPKFGSPGGAYLTLLGTFVVVTAILDHIRFVRTFSAAQKVNS